MRFQLRRLAGGGAGLKSFKKVGGGGPVPIKTVCLSVCLVAQPDRASSKYPPVELQAAVY